MGQQFTIEGEEAFALATELASLTGKSLDDAVTIALRSQIETERLRQAKFDRLMALTDEFRAMFDDPPPQSDHSWLYDDETGLPA